MSAPSVTLTGAAILGYSPPQLGRELRRAMLAKPPTVKLGRLAGMNRAGVPKLADFLKPSRTWRPPPASNYADKAAASISRMMANDQYGCCVISDRAHSLGLWTANDSDSGGEVIATDREVIAEYQRICGPGDRGCYITNVLDVAMTKGLTFGGKVHKIDGYCSVDPRNRAQVQAAQHLFGAVCFGISFRQAWANSAVWDVTNSPSLGGHDVGGCGYTSQGVKVMSWGRVYMLTYGAIERPDLTDEVYCVFAPAWYGRDGLAPAGVQVDELRKAFEDLRSGTDPDPKPPAPPEPPAPPAKVPFRGVGQLVAREPGGPLDRIIFEGEVGGDEEPDIETPGDEVTVECGDNMVASSLAAVMFPVMGCDAEVNGTSLKLTRKELTPEQWAALIEAIAAFAVILSQILNKQGGSSPRLPDTDEYGDSGG